MYVCNFLESGGLVNLFLMIWPPAFHKLMNNRCIQTPFPPRLLSISYGNFFTFPRCSLFYSSPLKKSKGDMWVNCKISIV